MRIAQVAPPWISIPPPGYGGIEWVVSMLADGLTQRGHDVTLFASGDSVTTANLDSVFERAPGPDAIGDIALEVTHAYHAYQRADDFDVIHDHTTWVSLALGALREQPPVVHTIHGMLDERSVNWYRSIDRRVHLVSISDSQRAPAPTLRYAGRVYNGIPLERYPFRAEKEDFLFFVGRASYQKGPHVAAQVARKTGRRLVMAVAIKEPAEKDYWAAEVEPLLNDDIELLGEITVQEKAELMGRARAVLFPIGWPEPFGLVMAEANACGTPVIAFRQGAAPEVIAEGVSGFVVDDVEQMCAAVQRCDEIDPRACRAHVEQNFSAEVMVRGYEEIYARVTR